MGMNIALWIVTGLLAAIYLFSGLLKIAWSKDRIHATNDAAHWVEDFSPGMVKAIAALEVLGAAGLVLPAILESGCALAPRHLGQPRGLLLVRQHVSNPERLHSGAARRGHRSMPARRVALAVVRLAREGD